MWRKQFTINAAKAAKISPAIKNMKKEAMGLPNPNPMTGKVFSGGKMKGKANPKIPKSTPKTTEKIP